MPCILHGAAIKIRDTISSQVSGRAQLPGVIIYIVDQESNTAKSGGHTSTIWAHPNTYIYIQPCAYALHSHARARGLFTAPVYYWQTCAQEGP